MARTAGQYPPCLRCVHCDKRKRNRPRNLCFGCYYTPGVRDKYGPVNKYGRRGVGHGGTARPLPKPVDFLAGTPEKLAELVRRAELGLELWHPADGTALPLSV